jgi:hypothetical protein
VPGSWHKNIDKLFKNITILFLDLKNMTEDLDRNLKLKDERSSTNLALANAYIVLTLQRMTPKRAYSLYQVLETYLAVDASMDLNVVLSRLLEEGGIDEKEIEIVLEALKTEEGKQSVKEFFGSSGIVSNLIRDFREKAWVVILNEKPSEWPSMVPMTYLPNVLTISEVMTALAHFEKPDEVELHGRVGGLIENLKTEFDEQKIIGIFKFVRDKLLNQTDPEV